MLLRVWASGIIRCMKHSLVYSLALFAVLILLSACSPAQVIPLSSATPPLAGELIPYRSATPSATPQPTDAATPTPLPTPTPTPRTHLVKDGEDMFGIAYRYGLNVQTLMAANPDVNPRAMSVGQPLVIPYAVPTESANNPPMPTPVGLALGQPICYPAGDGSLVCFVQVTNEQSFGVESLAVAIRLYDTQSGQIYSQNAYAPLNLIPAQGSLPLMANFPAPAPQEYQLSAELISAIPLPAGSERYLPVLLQDQNINIAENGLSVQVSGRAAVEGTDRTASQMWVAAVAFDAMDRVVGLRRWERTEAMPGGVPIDFALTVYSVGPEIVRIALFAEAVP